MGMLRRRATGRGCGARVDRLAALALVLSSAPLYAEEMLTRFHVVEAGVLESFRQASPLVAPGDDAPGRGEYRCPAGVKEAFERLGVSFPPGSRMGYSQRASTLFVTNTLENLLRIAMILAEACESPPQVSLAVRLVRLPWSERDRLATGAPAPKWGPDATVLLLEGTTASGAMLMMKQTVGVPTPTRATVQAVATVAADGAHIDLTLSLHLQGVKAPDGATPPEPTSIETKLVVEDSVPVLLNRSGPRYADGEEDAQRYVECVMVTASLVADSGEPYKVRRQRAEQLRSAWEAGREP